jgi:hypothetical protein
MMLFLSRNFILLPSNQVHTFSRSTRFTNIRKIVSLFNMTEQVSLRSQNKSFQQMQPIICLYCMCYFSPYMFRVLTGPSSGVSWAACLCYHLVHVVLLSVRASADGGLVVLMSWLFLYARCSCSAAVVSIENCS